MTNAELQLHCANKQVLWLVWGNKNASYMSACILRDHGDQWGISVWGYSVWRRSPGFRTIGQSIDGLKAECCIVKLFSDQMDAIEYYQQLDHSTTLSMEALKIEHTPNLKFLKKEHYRHNLSVEI